ncbi:alpha,alpha-trehalose-phosphate synthase (UDP-forming) [Caulobacter mirabilis]|uniref:alpha,alpha-trehalose-phosphate synthase (UDP-forming) n=1 Tax=Caulobacter mirabilis TaxID=69666 RepID=UPI000C1642A7|nr:alpha,alpha-trehalose-phosphate synthase (UDP-forming) [Caulobacter mirabilis]
MSRLIVVSNRVNLSRDTGAGAVGGLAAAIAAALRERPGIWFGWSGETTPQYTGQIAMERIGEVTVARVDLEEQDVEEYYNGYANKTLWPLFHNRIDLTAYERPFDAGYARVNRRFAEALAPLIAPDDLIWVHDYHLAPLARELRALGVKNRIGFFLHIPWPARQLLTTLPGHRKLVEALFHYDLIGFQTEDHLTAVTDYLAHEIGAAPISATGEVEAFGLRTQLGVFPIGIEAPDFRDGSRSPLGEESFQRMRESQAGRKMVLGVDRLDYSKGLEERFLSYEQFLAAHEEQREKVFLLQIATLSRDSVEAYQELRGRLDAIAGRVNGAYGTVDWVPLRYINSGYRQDELAGIYRAAHVGLVTPLRDGMNLVAKEYVAAQDPEDPGVLILSRFAGAAAQMGSALIVNPYDRDDVAAAIQRALSMGYAERRKRWERLMETVARDDVSAWRTRFVDALGAPRRPRPRLANDAA